MKISRFFKSSRNKENEPLRKFVKTLMIDATEQRELYFEGEKGRVPCMGVSGFLASPFFSLLAYDTEKISPSKCSGRILRLFKSGKEDACTFHETGDHASVECT